MSTKRKSNKSEEEFYYKKHNYSDRVEDINRNGHRRILTRKKRHVVRKFFTFIFTFLVSIFLICVITGTIVSTAFTMYILNFSDDNSDVTIESLEQNSSTYVYANEDDGKLALLYEVSNGNGIQSEPVTIDKIPQAVRDAFVCTEDERFYTHDGVDYKRTFSAFLNMFLHFYNTQQGGSTITQQLIKNITGDNEQSPARKIREIFRAMSLEKKYSKDEILESYLNCINFGGTTTGIQAASKKYFGKDVSELDIAQAASLAAIPKSPSTLNPFVDKDANKERQRYVLKKMYDNGAITYDEYQKALHEPLVFKTSDAYVDLDKINSNIDDTKYYHADQPTTWVVDTAIFEFADYLSKTLSISQQDAIQKINSGGYKIYTTVDLDMQEAVEQKYSDFSQIVDPSLTKKTIGNDNQIDTQSAFIAMDYTGGIKAVVGAVGAKNDSLCWNYATMENRQPGSAIKPVSTYGAAIDSRKYAYGSLVLDAPIELADGTKWPTNYSTDSKQLKYSDKYVSIYYGLEHSLNTVSARLCQDLTPETVFDYATEKMGLDLLKSGQNGSTDIALSPLSVGALSEGVTLENLVNAYIPYGNGGNYYEAHIISKVEQGDGEKVYSNEGENKGQKKQVVDSQTAYIMNKLLQKVVSDGTGSNAKLPNKVVAGKTGTTENWKDLLFVGMTPDIVSGIWMGYTGVSEPLSSAIDQDTAWYNVIGEYANNIDSDAQFPDDKNVIKAYICKNTGKIATEHCPKGEVGYWRSDFAPVCDECGGHSPVYANDDGTPKDSTLYYSWTKAYNEGVNYSSSTQSNSSYSNNSGNSYSNNNSNSGGDASYSNNGGDSSNSDNGNSGSNGDNSGENANGNNNGDNSGGDAAAGGDNSGFIDNDNDGYDDRLGDNIY